MVQGGIGLFVRGGVEYSGVGPGRCGRRGFGVREGGARGHLGRVRGWGVAPDSSRGG